MKVNGFIIIEKPEITFKRLKVRWMGWVNVGIPVINACSQTNIV